MKFEHLRYFVEVVRSQSMNKAAKKLMVSQPTVSSTIKNLERELGFQLIERSSKGVRLTEKGRIVFEDAEQVLAVEQKWRAMDEYADPIGGAVNVTAVPSSLPLVLHSISVLKQTYPTVDVVIHDSKKANLLNLLRKQVASIGVYGFLDAEKETVANFARRQNYCIEELLTDSFCVFVASQHPFANNKHITLSDLKTLPVAIYAGEDPVAPLFVKYFSDNECYYMNNLETMMNFVLSDPVAAVCTKLYARHSVLVQQGLLKILDIEGFQVPFNYCLLYPDEEYISSSESVVVEQLRSEFSD